MPQIHGSPIFSHHPTPSGTLARPCLLTSLPLHFASIPWDQVEKKSAQKFPSPPCNPTAFSTQHSCRPPLKPNSHLTAELDVRAEACGANVSLEETNKQNLSFTSSQKVFQSSGWENCHYSHSQILFCEKLCSGKTSGQSAIGKLCAEFHRFYTSSTSSIFTTSEFFLLPPLQNKQTETFGAVTMVH